MLMGLRRLSKALGSVPSLAYALGYIGLIPSFAGFYYFVLPRDFYHSTAQFEYGPMSRASERILDGIWQSIVAGGATAGKEIACGKWQIDRDYLRPYALRVEGSNV